MDRSTPRIRVVIADDHPIFRDGLRRLLESEGGFDVVGEAADGGRAVTLVGQLKPDILMLDVAMPTVTGLAALQHLSALDDAVRTILLTAQISRSDIVAALHLGARGVVLKETATRILFACIRSVMAGQYWVGGAAVTDLGQAIREMAAGSDEEEKRKTFGLTRRELSIVSTIVAGYTNKDIAQKFAISEDTVKHHLTNIFDKTGVSSRLELGLFAVHHKLGDDS